MSDEENKDKAAPAADEKKGKGLFGGGNKKNQAKADDKKAEDKKAEDKKAEDKKADKAEDKKAPDAAPAADKAEDKKDDKPADKKPAAKKGGVKAEKGGSVKRGVKKEGPAKDMDAFVDSKKDSWKNFHKTRHNKWCWIMPEKNIIGAMANEYMGAGHAGEKPNKAKVMNEIAECIYKKMSDKPAPEKKEEGADEE